MALYVTRPRRDEVRIGRGLPSGEMIRFVLSLSLRNFREPLGNPRQIPYTTSDLGRIIVIHMRLHLTFVMRSVVGVPHRETPTRFL